MRPAQLLLVVAIGVSAYVLYESSADELPVETTPEEEPASNEELLEQRRLGMHRKTSAPASPSEGLGSAPKDLPRRWSELNDQAIAALEEGDLEVAIELFELCVEGQPDQDVFAKNLAEALARLARKRMTEDANALAASLPLLERATLLDPSRDDLLELLKRWKASLETEADFWTDETAHFSLSYDGERTELLKHGYSELTRLLEDVYDEFGVTLNHYPVGHGDPKLRVLIYDRDEFTKITGVGHWAGGVFDGTIRLPVADYSSERREVERVLRHELLHAFLQSLGGKDIPAWLNEGLAQRFEAGAVEARVGYSRQKLDGAALFALDDLDASFTRMGDESRIPIAYAQSMVIVDYLYRWYGEVLVLDLVRGCKQGRTCAETFKARTALDLVEVAADASKE